MKRIFITVFGMLIAACAYSQSVQKQTWTEDFNGTVSFTAKPAGSWNYDTMYYQPGPATTQNMSYLGSVPNHPGDTTILETQIYDCTSYTDVILRFSHICKVSPQDRVRIEYRTSVGTGMGTWDSISVNAYMGTADNFHTTGFNAESYQEWEASDSSVYPSQSWWKDELFDLTVDVSRGRVQFRFVIIHGNIAGTQASYGWLIDNFQLSAATHGLYSPIVEFVAPLVKDSVYKTGPWEINARVSTQTNAAIVKASLIYTAIFNGLMIDTDTLLMNYAGANLWKSSIPQYTAGTEVRYYVIGEDGLGNIGSAKSEYVIVVNNSEYVTVGTGIVRNYETPFGLFHNYSWTRQLYLGSEVGTGQITKLAWSWASTHTSTASKFSNQTCYFRLVDDISITSTAFEDPDAAGATQVWTGEVDIPTTPGWVEIELDQPFVVPPGKNLLIYWHHQSKSYMGAIYYWYHTTTAQNMTVYARLDGSFPSSRVGTLTTYRPNARFYLSIPNSLHSAALHSIDLNDTVIVTSTDSVPVIVTIENKGSSNLTSATVYYSVNGIAHQPYSWTGNLPWNYSRQDTIGYYKPSFNKYDIIKVDVKMPNGFTDSTGHDDTLSKIVYGATDILMAFENNPKDTVYRVGPFEINVRIRSFSGANIGAVSLSVATTYNAATTIVSYPVTFDAGANLWKTTIPQMRYGSGVVYSITLTDKLGNIITIADSLYTKHPPGNGIVGNGTIANSQTPVSMLYNYSWSRQLYLGSEIEEGNRNAKITKIAWEWASSHASSAGTWTNQTCYFRAVDDINITATAWENPETAGGTQVLTGSFVVPTAPGWVEFELDQPFVLPLGKNLLVYWHHQHGNFAGNYYQWKHTRMGQNMTVFAQDDGSAAAAIAKAGTLTADRPNIRFFIIGKTNIDTSVALASIESPSSVEITGVRVPIRVKISNYGMSNLKSCIVNWSINGGNPKSKPWTGDLLEDFTDTITLEDYIPVAGQNDTIVVWVSMPNGIADIITEDDTSKVMTVGCGGTITGAKTIPGDFTDINAAIKAIIDCGISGKAILSITGNYTGMIDLSALKGFLTAQDTLVIRSATGSASDAVFTVASGTPALRINNIRNLYVEHITLNAESGTHGVEIIDRCDNVEINGCIISANKTSTSSSNCGIYYGGSSTGPAMGNIRLLNNTIRYGYNGIQFLYFNPTTSAQSSSTARLRINGNTIEDPYHYGIYSYYAANFDSIAYNTINTRANVSSEQIGIYFMYYNNVYGGIIGNKINIRATGSSSYGIRVYENSLNYNAASPALVANNEIRKLSGGGTFWGIYHRYAKAYYIHNSVYCAGTGTNYCMYVYGSTASFPSAIMNNLFVSKGTGTSNYAIYAPIASEVTTAGGVTIDNNNYFSSGTYLCGAGGNIANLAAWQAAVQQDANSVNVDPDFVDVANSLEVRDTTGQISTPLITGVNTDITGRTRLSPTTMGAYDIFPTERDLSLLGFASWNNEVVKNQRVEVNVEAMNLGVLATEATFGWRLNGKEQPTFSWTASPIFSLFEQRTILIGTFDATGADTFNVEVWVKTINGQADVAQWNDTVRAWVQVVPLAKFVAPFIEDTIGSLLFGVNVKIQEGTGAPLTTPQMYIETLLDRNTSCYIHTYDTVTMVKEGDEWEASIPQQYYGSTVMYETHISDSIGNNITLRDTAHIAFSGVVKIDNVTELSYTGSEQTLMLPRGTYKIECWGGQGGSSNGGDVFGLSKVGGKGGYSVGEITLRSLTTAYIYVGGEGQPQGILASGGFNGGGNSGSGTAIVCGGGGGASDVRIGSNSLYSRVIVAGGGGAAGYQECDGIDGVISGGYGGGTTGGDPVGVYYPARIGHGGTQTAGGAGGLETYGNGEPGSFGLGGNGSISGTDGSGGGGGGGWYGGGAGANSTRCAGGGGGGSSYLYTSATAGDYPSGCLLNSSHYLANAQTLEGNLVFFAPDGTRETGHTGDGFVRITVISGGNENLYAGNNLTVFDLVPKDSDNKLCIDITTPVEIKLANLGVNDYDLTQDSVTISYEIINPRGIIYNDNIRLDTGAFLSGEIRTITLIPSMPVIAGSYTIKAWITSAIDNFSCDDTVNYIYTSSLLSLPLDEDFSGTFAGFVSVPIVGAETWTPYIDTSNQILPPTGQGRIMRHAGGFGTMAQLSTSQVDLSGVVDPELKFWYYHDATASDLDKSYTEVNIIVDNVSTTALTLSRRGATTGWQQYTVDLEPFTYGQCVLIQFESMNRNTTAVAQYLGHVTITSKPDLEVSGIIISPEVTVCEQINKDLKIDLTNVVNQVINFTQEDSLRIQISSQPPFTYPLTGSIAGNSTNTVSIASGIDLTGVSDIKVWLTSPVDNNPLNDTAIFVLDIRPGLSVTVKSLTEEINCFSIGTPVLPEVMIINTGNVDIPEIELTAFVDASLPQTVRDLLSTPLKVGDTVLHTFNSAYTAPSDASYQVVVTAWMKCDSAKANDRDATNECSDIHDLSIVSMDNPSGQTDIVGSTKNIEITIANTSDVQTYSNVTVMALIEDENETMLNSCLGIIPAVEPLDTISFAFTESYTVPDDSVYFIRIYLSKVDNYPENDTIVSKRHTEVVGIKTTAKTNAFTLNQNIPNPANNSTRIDYSIPEAGEVIFHVHSISGQLLYSQTIEASRGTNSLELNTSTFAAGVYFYSMEYKGQRLVKQLIIK